MPTLSQILKSKIGKGGKSKTYIADKLQVSEKTVENYMNGKRSPKPEALVELSKLLDFDLSELTNVEEKPEQIVPDDNTGLKGGATKIPLIPEGSAEHDLLKAITTLTESNKGLVDSNRSITDTNRVIADTNAILAQKLIKKDSEQDQEAQHTMDDTVAMVIALRESIVEITSMIKKVPKQEASQEFHSKVKAAKMKLGKKDSRAEADSQHR